MIPKDDSPDGGLPARTPDGDDDARLREAYRALADNVPDSVERLDREFRHLYINAAGAALVGRTPAEVIGKTNRELGVPDPTASLWEERIRTVFETGEPLEVEDSFPTTRGTRFLGTRCVPERSADGRVQTVRTWSRATSPTEDGLRRRPSDGVGPPTSSRTIFRGCWNTTDRDWQTLAALPISTSSGSAAATARPVMRSFTRT